MARKIKMIIFDLDGTLVDAYQAVSKSLNHALEYCGYPLLDDMTIKRSVGWGEKVLIAKFVGESDLDKVLSVYREHHRRALKSGTRFLPGAKEILDFARAEGYRLAIASNRSSRFTHIILKHLMMESYFDLVVCADQVENPKPSSDMIENILKRSGLGKEEVVYVGDMVIDVQTGRNAGVMIISVVTGSNFKEELTAQKPDAVIENILQLKNLLMEV